MEVDNTAGRDVEMAGEEGEGEVVRKLEQEVGGGVELLCAWLEMRMGQEVEEWLVAALPGLLALQVGSWWRGGLCFRVWHSGLQDHKHASPHELSHHQ